MSAEKIAQLKKATNTDPQLQQVSSMIKAGWPTSKQDNAWHSGITVMNSHCQIMSYSRVRK